MNDWQPRVRRLVKSLVANGALTDPAWRAAFEAVPRHVFVPRFYDQSGALVDGEDPEQQPTWLDAVYEDSSLVTKLAPLPGTDIAWSVSSSTMPSLMARMLELLDVADGHRVMEIGTGTGYNAALLCHRLGETSVASIDIDPVLIDAARDRLAELGYHPHLAAGDGAGGVAERAPYDRIIATCAVPAVPPAWITQLTEDGLIVADVRGEIASSLIALRKIDNVTVRGWFLPTAGHFMWLRAAANNPLRDGGSYQTVTDLDNAHTRPTDVDPADLDHPDLRFVLQFFIPDAQSLYRVDHGGVPVLHLRTTDGSWADATTGTAGHHVTEGGPRRMWALAEQAARLWARHGQPTRSRFGLTATTDGTQRLWLDDPTRELTMKALASEPRRDSRSHRTRWWRA